MAVLVLMAKHPRITARELSLEVGVTERTVRMIIHDLEEAGYIVKSREGRGVLYTVKPETPLRHQTQDEKAVGQLMSALGCSSDHKVNGRPDFKP